WLFPKCLTFRMIEKKSRTSLQIVGGTMTKEQREEVLTLPTFGRRKMASRVCVVDGKPHVRKFLCETLEDIGFIACECAHVGALGAVLHEPLGVDLVVVGSANGVEAAAVVEALAAQAFGGKVLL